MAHVMVSGSSAHLSSAQLHHPLTTDHANVDYPPQFLDFCLNYSLLAKKTDSFRSLDFGDEGLV